MGGGFPLPSHEAKISSTIRMVPETIENFDGVPVCICTCILLAWRVCVCVRRFVLVCNK